MGVKGSNSLTDKSKCQCFLKMHQNIWNLICGLRGQTFINPYRELSFGFKIWCRGKSSGIRRCDLNPDSDEIAVQFLLSSVTLDLCLLICK